MCDMFEERYGQETNEQGEEKMKKYTEILEEIKKTAEEYEAAKRKASEFKDRLNEKCNNVSGFRERVKIHKAAENEILKYEQVKEDLLTTIGILENNAKVALFNEVMPLALEILKKYKGKSYRFKKVQEMIDNEVEEATNCHFYIEAGAYKFHPNRGLGNNYYWLIHCGTEYKDGKKKALLIGDKIQEISFEEIKLYLNNTEYVENIPHRIEEIKMLRAEADKKQKELKEICDKYNALVVEGCLLWPRLQTQ